MLSRSSLSATTAAAFLLSCAAPSQYTEATGQTQPALTQPSAVLPVRVPLLLDAMPRDIFTEMTSGRALVGSRNLGWDNDIITVAFNGGSEELYRLVEATGPEWTRSGGRLSFSFRDRNGNYRRWSYSDRTSSADIRISFREDAQVHGYWSVLGRLAESVSPNKPTMNYGKFPTDVAPFFGRENSVEWMRSYYRYTILHEFGHALGLSHEHYHADCQSDLLLSNAVSYLIGPPNNWEYEPARYSMDANFYFTAMKDLVAGGDAQARASLFQLSPRIDQASVMLYSFANVPDGYLFRSGSQSLCKPTNPVGFATSLSAGDTAAYLSFYPRT